MEGDSEQSHEGIFHFLASVCYDGVVVDGGYLNCHSGFNDNSVADFPAFGRYDE